MDGFTGLCSKGLLKVACALDSQPGTVTAKVQFRLGVFFPESVSITYASERPQIAIGLLSWSLQLLAITALSCSHCGLVLTLARAIEQKRGRTWTSKFW
jgi:hypothetical protein